MRGLHISPDLSATIAAIVLAIVVLVQAFTIHTVREDRNLWKKMRSDEKRRADRYEALYEDCIRAIDDTQLKLDRCLGKR